VPSRRLPPARTATAIILAAIALLAVACVDSAGLPADCVDPSVSREATVTANAMAPRALEVCRAQAVTLTIDSEVDGVFHIHGYDDEVSATTINAGEELRLEFEATRSGQFVIDLHPADDPTGVSIGILTVHEP
jgi:hypothetical protein